MALGPVYRNSVCETTVVTIVRSIGGAIVDGSGGIPPGQLGLGGFEQAPVATLHVPAS